LVHGDCGAFGNHGILSAINRFSVSCCDMLQCVRLAQLQGAAVIGRVCSDNIFFGHAQFHAMQPWCMIGAMAPTCRG
jgi:hypothetical protein